MLPVSLCFTSSCVPYVASFSVFFVVLCSLCCQFLCVFRRLVYPMLPVSLCFSSSCVPYVASFSVFFVVLCTLCCQFLCVFRRLVYPMLPVSLCFSSFCVPYVASFSVFFVVLLPVSLDCPFFIGPSVFTDVYLTIFIVFNIYSRNTYPVITEMVYLIPFRNACTKSGSLRFSQFSGC
jgi:hypothetical protein